MPSQDETLLRRLRAAFRDEAREHVEAMAAGLIVMESGAAEARTKELEDVYRAAHSLKGAARTVNIQSVESVCQALESVFAGLKRGGPDASPELFDLLQRAVSALKILLPNNADSPAKPLTPEIHSILQALRASQSRPSASPPQTSSPPSTQATATKTAPAEPQIDRTEERFHSSQETVRVSLNRLETMLERVEAFLAVRLTASQRSRQVRHLLKRPEAWRRRWSRVRGLTRRKAAPESASSNGLRLSEFMEWNEGFHSEMESELIELDRATRRDEHTIESLTDRLLNELKTFVLQPCSSLFESVPLMVRDLSRRGGKEVDVILDGEDVELDRRIIEELKDPLIHLVRNSLDHGIETPETRTATGKSRRGTLRVAAAPLDGANVELIVEDDGAGIDLERVRAAALKSGKLSEDRAQKLTEQESLCLIFESGLSTSPMITDISGHGLGLAIVREKVETLDGTVRVSSKPGEGTVFRLIVPVTRARFRGLVIRVNSQQYVLPTKNVARVIRLRCEEIRTIENRPSVRVGDETLPVADLTEILGLKLDRKDPSKSLVLVVVIAGAYRVAFRVDETLSEDEVLVKPLGHPLKRLRHISGATVLGSGAVAPILHAADLIATALNADSLPMSLTPQGEDSQKKRAVLVAEDSITSRTLLKGVLESAGYQVDTAVDGVEAFSKLRSGEYDAVVSDVDMPRLNGFGLTAKIRADRRLGAVPVVLVTALDKPEDREHGIDAGASAYLVKSSFDQSNLLEVLERLL
jgi:two-component system chemotaxis sensor kinase CheA